MITVPESLYGCVSLCPPALHVIRPVSMTDQLPLTSRHARVASGVGEGVGVAVGGAGVAVGATHPLMPPLMPRMTSSMLTCMSLFASAAGHCSRDSRPMPMFTARMTSSMVISPSPLQSQTQTSRFATPFPASTAAARTAPATTIAAASSKGRHHSELRSHRAPLFSMIPPPSDRRSIGTINIARYTIRENPDGAESMK